MCFRCRSWLSQCLSVRSSGRKFFFEPYCLDTLIRSRRARGIDQDYDWDAHAGRSGKLYLDSILAFDFDNMHKTFTACCSTNNFLVGASPLFGHAVRWGISGHTAQISAKLLQDIKMAIAMFEKDKSEALNVLLIACNAVWVHWLAGDAVGARSIAAKAGSTIDQADAFMDRLNEIATPIFRDRGKEGSRGAGGFWGIERL